MVANAARSAVASYFGISVVAQGTTAVNTDTAIWVKTEDDADSMNPIQELVAWEPNDRYDMAAGNIYPSRRHGDGSMTITTGWDEAQDLLRILTGHNVTPAASGSLFDYDFDFVDPDLSSTVHYLIGSTAREVAIERFTNSADGNSVFYQGCIPVSWSVNFEPSGLLKWTINWIFRETTRTTKSTAVYSTNLMRSPTGQATVMVALTTNAVETTYISQGVTFAVNQPAAHRWDTPDSTPNAGTYPSEKRTITCEVDMEAPANDETFIAILENPEDTTKRFDTAKIRLEHTFASGLHKLHFDMREATIEPPATRKQAGIGLARMQISLMARHDGTQICEANFTGPTTTYKT